MAETNCPPLLQCRDHAFYLDLDGTLAEIVARPEQAEITEEMRGLIAQLAEKTQGAVAIISGRSLADVDRLLRPLHLPAAGAHGQELRRAGASDQGRSGQIDVDAMRQIDAFAARTGLLVERKAGSVALHYRSVPRYETACRDLIDNLTARDDRYRAIHGKMVSELAQRGCDKGSAISSLSESPPFKARIPVMVGDDVTDEDGFRAAQAQGGLGIKIGEGESIAAYRLESIAAFAEWLNAIVSRE